jgi:transketolase
MPCWELFEEQDAEYREQVLPSNVTARLAIEAGVSLGWDKYTGARGDCLCLDRFGASAPGDAALKNLGLNVENALQRARALLS